jgi:quinohemoprotein ethanol dehydrogenase
MHEFKTPTPQARPAKTLRRRLGKAGIAAAAVAALFGGAALAQGVAAGLSSAQITKATTAVNAKTMEANAKTSHDWPAVGGDYAETRFSHLDQINAGNVKSLGLVWTASLSSTRGVEATPVVVDGIMYVTAPWSIVHAIDVRTGQQLWTYDPMVPRTDGRKACCDVVNRGVAVYQGRVYVASFDGRLIALDAASGKVDWTVDTITDHSKPFTSTAAPRVMNGRVLIGNGGGEYGIRAYVSAYDANTGKLDWRWFVIPGDPSKPYENAAMKAAAKTWDPASKYWIDGGGGGVWDDMAFDPRLGLVYFGTGNGSPWSSKARSPGGGNNLYLTSVVALNVNTGKLAWYYQESPQDNWDYDADSQIILTDMKIGGTLRHVLLHAPKNGFFYVLDRTDGKFISAKPFVNENWASGINAQGVPQILPAALDTSKAADVIPGPYGGHNWQPMSYNPQTGDVYIPAQNVPVALQNDPNWSYNVPKPMVLQSGTGWNLGLSLVAGSAGNKPFGTLIAWNVAAQKPDWEHQYPAPWNGGTLTTAGNLVFQGAADGSFNAYDAKSGDLLWHSPTGSGVIAGASTYMVDDKQYVSVAVGWGGAFGLANHVAPNESTGTVYTFALGGTAPLPSFTPYTQAALIQGVPYNKADVGPGAGLYVENCALCHGTPGVSNGGNIPNLGYVPSKVISNLKGYIINGPYTNAGMPNFAGKLDDTQVKQIAAFIQGTADSVRPPVATPASAQAPKTQ